MTVKTSIHPFKILLPVLGLMFLLTQCQPVPRPFAALQKGDFSAVQLGPRAGVVVMPLTGELPDGVGPGLAEAMADALRAREITASTGRGHRRSHRLHGEVKLASKDELEFEWRLQRPDKTVALSLTRKEGISQVGWWEGDAQLIKRLANSAADAIDLQLRRQERGEGRRNALAPVTIGPVDGVPGDGGVRLAAAMREALADAGVPLSESPLEDGFILLGSMHLGPDGPDRRIELTWHLIRPDGSEFGTVSQANSVPRGQLSGDWRSLARAIAEAGAPGVRDLLRRDPG